MSRIRSLIARLVQSCGSRFIQSPVVDLRSGVIRGSVRFVRPLALMLLATAVALSALGCGDSTSNTTVAPAVTTAIATEAPTTTTQAAPGPQKGGVLRIALPKNIVTLDPQFAFDNYSLLVIDQIFDTLVDFGNDGTIIPRLATEWTTSADGLVWEFTIRDGVSFQNGRQLTVDDVVYTMNRMMDPKTKVPRQQLSMVKSVEAVGDHIVRFTLPKPYAPLLSVVGGRFLSIVPKEEIERMGEEKFARNPVGSGPFKFASWDQNTRVVLERNETYFFGQPNLDGVEFSVVPETVVAQQQLETGDVDVIIDVRPDDILRLQKQGLLEMQPGVAYYYIVANEHPKNAPMVAQLGKNPFVDVRVREAISLAFDVDAAVNAVYPGLSDQIRAYGPVANSSWAFDPKLKDSAVKPDIERAKSLLAEAGYPNGFSVNLLVMSDAARQAIGQIFQNSLSQVGIVAKIDSPEFGVLLEHANAQTFDIGVFGWGGNPDPNYAIYPLLHSSARGPGGNNAWYSNADVDRLLDDAATITDQSKRTELYAEAQAIAQKEFVHIPLFYKPALQAKSTEVQGLVGSPYDFFHLVTETANVWLER